MAAYDKLTQELAAKLQPGDTINIRSVQSSDFRSYSVDATTVLGMLPAQVILSLTHTEPRNIVTHAVIKHMDPNGSAQVEGQTIDAEPIQVEDLQVRLRPEVAIEMAIAVLVNIGMVLPDLVRTQVRENKRLTFLYEE